MRKTKREYNLANLPNIFLLFVFNGKDPSEPEVKKYYTNFFPSNNKNDFRNIALNFCEKIFTSNADKQLGLNLIKNLWDANKVDFCVLWCSQSSLESQENGERETAIKKQIQETEIYKKELQEKEAAFKKELKKELQEKKILKKESQEKEAALMNEIASLKEILAKTY